MQCTGTCLVSSCLQLIYGKFEDAFDDFYQRFANLLDVYRLVVSDSLYCIPIFIFQGRLYRICIRHRMSRSSLSERPSNSFGIFRLYQCLPCTYLSLNRCFGSSGISRQGVYHILLRMYSDQQIVLIEYQGRGGGGYITDNFLVISANTCWDSIVGS